MPEFYIIIARKIFFPIFFLGGGARVLPAPPSPTPMIFPDLFFGGGGTCPPLLLVSMMIIISSKSCAWSAGGVRHGDHGGLGALCRRRCGLLASRTGRSNIHDRHLHSLVRPRRRRRVRAASRCPSTALGTADQQRGAALLDGLRTAAAAEQVAVVVAAELAAEEVESERIDARVDERQTVGADLEDVPEHVVLGRVEVVPEVPDVTRQPTHDKHDHERQHQTCDLLASFYLQHGRKTRISRNT